MSWPLVKFEEYFSITSGGTPRTDKKEYYSNGTIPWVKTGDLKGKYANYPTDFITLDGLKNSSAKLFPEKTVLLAMYGATIGGCSILNFEAATNQACAALLPSKEFNENYLYYFLLSQRSKLIGMGVGGAQPNISIGIIKKLRIPLSPLSIQKQVAEILGHADALRKKDLQLFEHYDALAQSLLIDFFGDPIKNERGWEIKKLGEISSKILSGNTPKGGSEVYVEKGVNFFRSQNVWKNELIYDDIAYIDKDTHAKMKNSSVMHKDILMTKTGRVNTENSSLGRAALFFGEDNSANVNGHVYIIRLKANSVHEFVLRILTSIEYRGYIRNVCVGGIDKRQLNKDHIEEFPIIYPPLEFQRQFAIQIQNIELQKEKVKAQIRTSENLFQALLQKAFSLAV